MDLVGSQRAEDIRIRDVHDVKIDFDIFFLIKSAVLGQNGQRAADAVRIDLNFQRLAGAVLVGRFVSASASAAGQQKRTDQK